MVSAAKDAAPSRPRFQDAAAADHMNRRIRANDEAVVAFDGKRFFQANLRPGLFARLELLFAVHEQNASERLSRAVGNAHAHAGLERFARTVGVKVPELAVKAVACGQEAGFYDKVTRVNFSCFYAGQV